MTLPSRLHLLLLSAAISTQLSANDWPNWRGPLQSGASLEHYEGSTGQLTEPATWTYSSRSRGCPVVFDGRVFSFGYRGEKSALVELLTCLDEKTGAKLWEVEIKDFISDTVYDRYSIGAATVDPETRRVYLITCYGVLGCWDLDGKEIFRISMMETYGRLTFPNSRVGCVVIEDDLLIVRGITANWGADGPAADRFYGFDKLTGELVWSCTPGTIPPTDSTFSTPVLATHAGQRVLFSATGCGNLIAINARNGKPLWRFKGCKVGINGSVLLHNGHLIVAHGDENVDTTERGRMMAIRLPETFADEQIIIDPEVLDGIEPWKQHELWRNDLGAATSSAVLVGDTVYQITDGGAMLALDAATGKARWNAKLSNGNTHASPVYADGFLYAPLMEGKLFVVNAQDGSIVQTLQLEGNCIGAAMVVNGHVLVHTTEKLYRFAIQHSSLTVDPAPVADIPAPGPPVSLQVIPSEFVMYPGETKSFRVRKVDAIGIPVGPVEKAVFNNFIPPTARVKSSMDATFNADGILTAAADAKLSAGAFKAEADGLSGVFRGRLLQRVPFSENFDNYELNEAHPTEGLNFAYPPLAWIGARFKFDIRELDGQKVFAKTFDRLIFQRATVFLGTEDMSNYILQADIMTDGSRRVKSDIGLINQRYAIVLKGNANLIEISSNFERFVHSVPFKVDAKKWYTMKTKVTANADGTGIVHAKVWERGQPEPDDWTLEATTDMVHQSGSPGIFGFTPQNQQRVYLDNLSVTPQ
jgi:outer membrane protein assembly factor BamB